MGFFWLVPVSQDLPIPDEQGKKSTQNAMEDDMEWKEKVKLEQKRKIVNIPQSLIILKSFEKLEERIAENMDTLDKGEEQR